MASVPMSMPLSSATHNRVLHPTSESLFKPLPLRHSKTPFSSKPKSRARLQVQASLKEKAVTGLSAAALTVSMVIPQVAEAADSGVTPSLKNFLLSILAGGVVLVVLVGAVIGVANFDPVKRS
ncbi:hypothetical protein SLEP1_g15934 [Rubroshorea leprosula]|uniref:Photosystem II PsbX n=1 Tax=Rubroshorea leprosula TaxID=152421 RepID=A0AAV5J0S3_9ROSI|nr:hypothetical protein SLEP1_g15934 [Rubroshorea leprosula]